MYNQIFDPILILAPHSTFSLMRGQVDFAEKIEQLIENSGSWVADVRNLRNFDLIPISASQFKFRSIKETSLTSLKKLNEVTE